MWTLLTVLKSHSIKGFRCDARKALSKEDMMRLKSSDEPSERRRGKPVCVRMIYYNC